jgi:hypothetical protein
MKYLRIIAGLAFAVWATAFLSAANAQTVTQLPVYVDGPAAKDFGNGPIELKIVQGNAIFTTSQGFGVISSVSGTLITLTATPTNIPCVNNGIATSTALNCAIGGGGITAGSLVGSYNASTGTGTGTGPSIGIPTGVNNLTVAVSQVIGWGAACPATLPAGVSMPLQTGQPAGDYPMYTYSRVCAYAPNGPGAMVMPFAIGAH